MKKAIVLLLAVAMMVSVAGCQSGSASAKEKDEYAEIESKIEDNFEDQVIFDRDGIKVTLENAGNFLSPMQYSMIKSADIGRGLRSSAESTEEMDVDMLNNSDDEFTLKLKIENNTKRPIDLWFRKMKFNGVAHSQDSNTLDDGNGEVAEKGTSTKYVSWYFDSEELEKLGSTVSEIDSFDFEIESWGIKDTKKYFDYTNWSEYDPKEYIDFTTEAEEVHVDVK